MLLIKGLNAAASAKDKRNKRMATLNCHRSSRTVRVVRTTIV
jgi:hypothetical protein